MSCTVNATESFCFLLLKADMHTSQSLNFFWQCTFTNNNCKNSWILPSTFWRPVTNVDVLTIDIYIYFIILPIGQFYLKALSGDNKCFPICRRRFQNVIDSAMLILWRCSVLAHCTLVQLSVNGSLHSMSIWYLTEENILMRYWIFLPSSSFWNCTLYAATCTYGN